MNSAIPRSEASAGDISGIAARTPELQSIAETGLQPQMLTGLAAKTVHYHGQLTELDLVSSLGLNRTVVDSLIAMMRREGFLEVLSATGPLQYRYALTDSGRRHAMEASERDQYVGPAPVTLAEYTTLQARQTVDSLDISLLDVERALADLVLPTDVVASIAAGVISTGAVLLYGPSGNGKSTIAAAIREMLPGLIAVPHALAVGARTMRFLDRGVHTEVQAGATLGIDHRFAICHRPIVTLGTELSLADLQASYSDTDRTYVAPPQLKAAGGVMVVDDLGRQAILPAELLNRWLTPMATNVDQLNLRSGEMLRVPFDMLLIFATNLDPEDLGDEAFLRRIRHKIRIPDPSPEEFIEIFRRAASRHEIPFESDPVNTILREYYEHPSRPIRGAHAGDLIQNVIDFSKVDGVEPRISDTSLRRASDAYFVRRAAV